MNLKGEKMKSKSEGGAPRTHMKSQLLLFALLILGVIPAASLAQKGSFGEIKQLQSPQDPQRGFMVEAVIPASLTEKQENSVRDKLKQVINATDAALRSGTSARAVVKAAVRTMASTALFSEDFAIIALDRKGRLASRSSRNPKAGTETVTSKVCAAGSIGSADETLAKAVCAEVEQHAMTVQSAVDSQVPIVKNKSAWQVIAMDKFGNMAMTKQASGVYRAYLGPDGKPVIEIYK